MKIQNNKELNNWMNERRILQHNVVAIKGIPPPGMTYSDGDPVLNPVNIAWIDIQTNERFDIIYGR
jgi:hypothetical protein